MWPSRITLGTTNAHQYLTQRIDPPCVTFQRCSQLCPTLPRTVARRLCLLYQGEYVSPDRRRHLCQAPFHLQSLVNLAGECRRRVFMPVDQAKLLKRKVCMLRLDILLLRILQRSGSGEEHYTSKFLLAIRPMFELRGTFTFKA